MAGSPSDADRPVATWFDAVGIRRRYPPQSFLFHEQDPPHSVLLVETGLIRIERTTIAGRRLLLDVATPGDLVGELGAVDESIRSTTASTIDETRVVVVTADEFRDHLRADAPFADAVLRRVVGRLRELSDQLVEATSTSAAVRVASRLVTLVDVDDDGPNAIELPLPFSQEELAQWAGLSREGTVKGLRELREAGLIETGRRHVTIHDLAGLRRRAARLDR